MCKSSSTCQVYWEPNNNMHALITYDRADKFIKELFIKDQGDSGAELTSDTRFSWTRVACCVGMGNGSFRPWVVSALGCFRQFWWVVSIYFCNIGNVTLPA